MNRRTFSATATAPLLLKGAGTNDPPYLSVSDVKPVMEASVRYGLIPKAFDAATMLNPVVLRARR